MSSIDDILRDAMEPVLKRASAAIAKAISEMADPGNNTIDQQLVASRCLQRELPGAPL
ncbi:MAG TPA: hypothetical protein VFP65_15570 [Anaeromyxobacteraceae bacterium]|nr:hypothetical protein [Anaeromyxobacteraceae bacterium]